MCVCMCVRVRVHVLFAHTRGSGLYVFFFPRCVQLLGNCLYALEFPSADGNGSVQPPHIPHLPFLTELPPFCFFLLPLSCSLLPAVFSASAHLLMLDGLKVCFYCPGLQIKDKDSLIRPIEITEYLN